MNIVERMARVAMIAHNGANRKGPGGIPYIVHPHDVVCMLKSWGYSEDRHPVTLSVAWTHDVLEDTDASEGAILQAAGGEYGEQILDGVKTLTFACPVASGDPTRKALKNAYIEKVANEAPPEILAVKIADRLCNTMDFLAGGNAQRAQAYLGLGEPLFARIDEIEFGSNIRATLEMVREKIDAAMRCADGKEKGN